MLLQDKTVVMTGGASGIGRATVLMLAKEGARVLLGDINEAGAEETIKMSGGTVDFVKLDLTDGASVDDCARQVLQRAAAKIDILVNAAGWDRTQPFIEADQAFIDKVLAINLLGPLRLTRALFPAMIQGGGGKIVFVASDAGRVGSLGETPYAAAKGGIIGFTKSLAREGARHKITVNCVCPGPTDTPLFHANPERMRDALLRAIPFRRLATPDDIAGAILYFAGPTSDYVTGQILSVSGGLTMAG
ncbi:MAG: SDR family NAD(P)-dependent oxidoreductase [Hyphomicrobiaceae bacterium]